MYPITFIPVWASIVGVIVAVGLSYWVANEDNSPRPMGLGAVFISLVTATCWIPSLPAWTAIVVIIATLGLFIAGMLVPDTVDDWLHNGAMLIALFGKLVAGLLPLIWGVLTGQVTIPVFVLLGLVLLAIVGFIGWRSERLRRMFGRLNPTT